jgi:serine/threonine-protein kinase
VDDSIAGREVLAVQLRQAGYEVIGVGSAAEALAVLEREPIDLVLTDLVMPGMNGLELVERLRHSYSKLDLPVLMVTARSDSSDVVRSLELGANDYVTKPLDVPVMLARIQAQIALRTSYSSSVRGAVARFIGDALEPGTIIDGRYRIQAVVGEGGFAVVYRALQLSTGQAVAVKVLRMHRLATAGSVEVELARFEREMRLIAKVKNPHIVRLLDSGQLPVFDPSGGRAAPEPTESLTVSLRPGHEAADPAAAPAAPRPARHVRLPYLVMELLEGQTLAALLRSEQRLAVERTLELILPVISAVDAAHQHGVVHRDLKPENIVLVTEPDGRVSPKVLDFGVAKLLTEDGVSLTNAASLVGTPRYLSPEQARGRRDVDARADQFALATIVYECLSGVHPFQADTSLEYVHLIAEADAVPVTVHAPDVPERLALALRRALNAEPAARFESLRPLAVELLPFASASVRARWARAFGASSDTPPGR